MCGFIAQLVEQGTGNAEVTGSNPVEALTFFRLLLSNCLNWKIYCDDHSSLSSTTAVQKWIISYILHIKDVKVYRCLYGRGQVCDPHLTNVCKISRLSLVFNKSLSNLAILLILKRSFQWYLSMSKVEKNSEKVYWKSIEKLLSQKNFSLIYQIIPKIFFKNCNHCCFNCFNLISGK